MSAGDDVKTNLTAARTTHGAWRALCLGGLDQPGWDADVPAAECSVDTDGGAAACCWRAPTTQVLTPTTSPTTTTMAVRSRSFAQIDRLPVILLFLQSSLSSHQRTQMGLPAHFDKQVVR
jgi:hypothetical protein